jgi:YD repeat-containing protein
VATTTYDALGRVTRESNRGLATQYEYDQNGNRTLMVDPSGGRFTYLYDEVDAPLMPRVPFRDFGPRVWDHGTHTAAAGRTSR